MAECKNCISENVCKYKDEKVSLGTTVKETVHNCKDFKDKSNFAEVKHGYWIKQDYSRFKPIYRCSVCNRILMGYADPNKVPYCHCGAKMGGKEGGEEV